MCLEFRTNKIFVVLNIRCFYCDLTLSDYVEVAFDKLHFEIHKQVQSVHQIGQSDCEWHTNMYDERTFCIETPPHLFCFIGLTQEKAS